MPTPSRAHSVERAMLFVCISRNSKFQAEPLSLSLKERKKLSRNSSWNFGHAAIRRSDSFAETDNLWSRGSTPPNHRVQKGGKR